MVQLPDLKEDNLAYKSRSTRFCVIDIPVIDRRRLPSVYSIEKTGTTIRVEDISILALCNYDGSKSTLINCFLPVAHN